jgi:hypothetical protein
MVSPVAEDVWGRNRRISCQPQGFSLRIVRLAEPANSPIVEPKHHQFRRLSSPYADAVNLHQHQALGKIRHVWHLFASNNTIQKRIIMYHDVSPPLKTCVFGRKNGVSIMPEFPDVSP